VIHIAGILLSSRGIRRGRSMVAHAVGEVLRVAAHEERTLSLGINPHPPPQDAIAFSLLESFHPRGRDRPAEEAKLTQREASHFINAWPPEVGSKRKKRRSQRGKEGTVSLGPLFIAPVDALRVALSPSISLRRLKRPRGTRQMSLNPRNTSPSGCVMKDTQ
jgi:hypothetical protein